MEETQFKPFHETYKLITFCMCVGLIYPNPATDKRKIISFLLASISISGFVYMILLDIYKNWLARDIVNIIRHTTVLGPLLGAFSKILLMYNKREASKGIVDEMNRDFEAYNGFSGEYRATVAAGIRNSVIYSERCWAMTIVCCVMIFPTMAATLTTYNFTFKWEPQKYMVHDVEIPFTAPEERFESPFYEIMFVYTFYIACLGVISFVGFDGFFGLCVNHACLKIDLFCKAMEDAMKGGPERIHDLVVKVIKDHQEMYRFVGLIQETFNVWLGLVFITMIQVCNCLYQITEGYAFDLRYLTFTTLATIHIYLPCRYAAKVKFMSTEVADRFYSSGWENVHDQGVRKMVLFMIARSQVPIELSAFNMVTFDMELFKSMMQTSYSLLTLLRS